MFIKFARFKNFVKHSFLEVNFEKGLVAIIGANGNGKSTITDGLYAALTNDFGRFGVNKASCIHDQATDKQESSVYIEAEHNGAEFKLLRGVRPNRSELSINGGPSIRKTEDIREALEGHLGINRKVMSEYVFIPQWGMASFLSATSSERSKLFQQLCNTQKAEQVYAACGDLLKKYEPNFEEAEGNIDELVEKVADFTGRAESNAALITEAAGRLLTEQNQKKAKAVLVMFSKREEALKSLEGIQPDHQEAARSQATLQTAMVDAQAEYDEAEIADTGAAKAVGRAYKTSDAWKVYDAGMEERKSLEADMTALQVEAVEWSVKKYLPADKADALTRTQALEADYYEFKRQLQQAQATVDLFADEGVVSCPTCGVKTDSDALVESTAAAKKALDLLPSEIDAVKVEVDKLRVVLASMTHYDRWESGYSERVKTVEALLARTASVKPNMSSEEAEEIIKDGTDKRHVLAVNKKALSEAVMVYREVSAKVETLDGVISGYKDILESHPLTEDTRNRADTRLKEHKEAELDIAKLNGIAGVIDVQLVEAKEALRLLEERSGRNQRLRDAVEQLRNIRGVFHRDELPRIVAQGNLINMEADINRHLELFGNPFWVESNDDLSFTVHFPGEPAKRAEQLSGGQQAVLAMAFRCAINSLFKADVGMMVLDEPAAGLDSQNLEYLRETLEHLASQVRDERQIIIITHQEQLRPAFDRLIEV